MNLLALSGEMRLVWVDPQSGEITETDTAAGAFFPDPSGDLLMLSSGDAVVSLIFDRGPNRNLPPPKSVVRSLVSSTDLSTIHDLGSMEPAATKPGWSADGSLLGDVSWSGLLRIWDTSTGDQLVSVPVADDASDGDSAWVSFDVTNRWAAVTRLDGEITIYSIGNPDQLGPTVRPAGSRVGSVDS